MSYAFEEFQMRNKVKNLSIASIKGYRETFDRFAATSANDLKCDDIGQKTIDTFVSVLMDDGIKASSINHSGVIFLR